MKILVVGSDQIFAIENFYVKHLRNLGVQVIHFPAQRIFSQFYQKNVWNKVLFKAGISAIYASINKQLLSVVDAEAPQVVWVFKGMEIFTDTLLKIKSKGIKLCNYNPDNPFIFSGRGSGNSNITRGISYYDLHFTYNREIQTRLENDFRTKVAYLPFGFEIPESLFQECETLNEINRICFLGNPDKQRAQFISRLAESNFEIDVYGHNWAKFVRHPMIHQHEAVYGDDQWRTLRKYRVQLNLMRPHNEDSHNMRTFEIPGIGGIMLAIGTTEQRSFFEDGKEAFFFTNEKDCSHLASRLQQMTSFEANKIRKAARERSLNSGYGYDRRAAQSLEIIQNMIQS